MLHPDDKPQVALNLLKASWVDLEAPQGIRNFVQDSCFRRMEVLGVECYAKIDDPNNEVDFTAGTAWPDSRYRIGIPDEYQNNFNGNEEDSWALWDYLNSQAEAGNCTLLYLDQFDLPPRDNFL